MTTKTAPLAYSPAFTAALLAASLGDSELIWTHRLSNWRRPGRTGPIPWQANEAGRPVYLEQNVRDFIETKRQAMDGALAKDPDQRAMVKAMADSDGQRAFIRLAWNSGDASGLVSLSITSAEALVKNLQGAITRAQYKPDVYQRGEAEDNQD